MKAQSKHLVVFLYRTILSVNFWLLFLASFTGVLMLSWRSAIRDDIFKLAQKTIGKRVS